ncbi:hypothetical protein BPTFM16_02013 [Altererythrobacter insulae]|nr:hypothetical protein BPTFM16_02013 [Altererythrobacter insulae]
MFDNHPDLRKPISLLWLFAILNMLFRDIHELTMASSINEILSGYVNGNPMTEQVLLFGAFAVEILLLGFLMSALLSPRHSKMLNLLLPPLAILGIVFAQPGDPDDYFFAGVTTVTFIVIFMLAWSWDTTSKNSGKILRIAQAETLAGEAMRVDSSQEIG